MSPDRDLKFVANGGRLIAVAAAAAADTGFRTGRLYLISLMGAAGVGAMAACRWGANDPTVADAGFDFTVSIGEPILIRVPAGVTELRAIRVVAVDATLMASLVDEGA
jgi:hypothetical protein